jgi:serine/threonine-protein kinase
MPPETGLVSQRVPKPVQHLDFDPASLVGTTLDGQYRIDCHLASGGMGAVFRAHHLSLRKDVALKVLRPELTASTELQERFRRESEIAAALEHRHIVRVTDFRRSPEGLLYLAMELLDGESLFDRLRREGFLPPDEAVEILWQLCDGLEAAHGKGVVHRDLKPENVFLARGPGGELVKILDFGIAKMAEPGSGSATQAGMVVGTPEYLSPEQATGSGVDARSDLYTVGLIGWRMLGGRHPFKASDARGLLMMQATQPVPPLVEARPDLAAYPLLLAAIARACAKDPAARHQSAAEFKADLGAVLDHGLGLLPVTTPPPAVSYTSLSPAPSSPGQEAGSTIQLGAPYPPEEGRVATPVGSPLTRRFEAQLHRHPRIAVGLGLLLVAAAVGSAFTAVQTRRATLARQQEEEARAASEAESERVRLAAMAAKQRAAELRRPLDEAERELAARRPARARTILTPLLRNRANEPIVHQLLGHAWQDEGDFLRALDEWTTALALAPLDRGSLDMLVEDLGRDRTVADRAAHLLVTAGPAAGPALAAVPHRAPTQLKLRALHAARQIGPGAKVDAGAGYLALLGEPDCDVRKAASRALGELRERRALARLRQLAEGRDTRRLGIIIIGSKQSCGAAEAGDAVRRIEGR